MFQRPSNKISAVATVKNLMGLSLVLFFSAALPLAFIEDPKLGRLFASAAAIFLGSFMIAFGADAMTHGRMTVRGSVIRRSTHPRMFGAAALIAMCSGVVLIVLALLPVIG